MLSELVFPRFTWLSAVSLVHLPSLLLLQKKRLILHSVYVLRWPRGCKRGVSQKEAWIREGVSRGLLLENFPYIAGSIEALNYISQAKVTVREDVFEEEKAEAHVGASASSSSANPSAASSTPSPPVVPTTVSVPTGVKIYGAANDLAEWEFEQKGSFEFFREQNRITRRFSFLTFIKC